MQRGPVRWTNSEKNQHGVCLRWPQLGRPNRQQRCRHIHRCSSNSPSSEWFQSDAADKRKDQRQVTR